MSSTSEPERHASGDGNQGVETGVPDAEGVLELLNSAYDGWGDEHHFEWRYDRYPEYDPSKHAYHITYGEKIVAFRRATYKELEREGTKTPFFVLGDTAVSRDYRGQGLYSKLHSETMEYCERSDVPLAMTFNRRGNLTYKANLKRGWNYRQLPVYLRIFRPSNVLPEYARLALDDKPRIRRIMSLLGGRVVLDTSSDRIPVADLVDEAGGSEPRLTLSVSLSDRAVSKLVGQVSNDPGVGALFKRSLGLLLRREISPFGNPKTDDDRDGAVGDSTGGPTVDRIEDLSEDELEDVLTLYEDFDVTMRRDRIDLEHMLDHPHLVEILLARAGGEIIGFAPVAFHSGSAVREARTLDFVVEELAFGPLVDAVESVAREHDADLLAIMSASDPGEGWVGIEKQVLMWDRLAGGGPSDEMLKNADWHVGFFDVA